MPSLPEDQGSSAMLGFSTKTDKVVYLDPSTVLTVESFKKRDGTPILMVTFKDNDREVWLADTEDNRRNLHIEDTRSAKPSTVEA